MDLEVFIESLKRIDSLEEKDKENKVRELMLSLPCSEAVHKTNEEAILYSDLIRRNYSYVEIKKEKIPFNNVLGGTHVSYEDMSPYDLISYGMKRSNINFSYLASNPYYYFSKEQEEDEHISFISFNKDNDLEEKKYICEEGNHRCATGLFLNASFKEEVEIANVTVSDFYIDWELVDIINKAKTILSEYDYELKLFYKENEYENIRYNSITGYFISSYELGDDFSTTKMFNYSKNFSKEEYLRELNIIKSDLNDIAKRLPFSKYISYKIKSFFSDLFNKNENN